MNLVVLMLTLMLFMILNASAEGCTVYIFAVVDINGRIIKTLLIILLHDEKILSMM